MRAILFLFLLITIGSSVNSQDTLFWSVKRKLTWKDFRGVPDTLSTHNAMTMAGMKYSIRYGETSFSYWADCYFLCQKSWTLTDSLGVLSHEQTHFDISELFTRKLRKAFSEYKYNYATVSQDLQKIQADILLARDQMNKLYDQETDYSRNRVQQQAWNSKIKSELDKLKDCASK